MKNKRLPTPAKEVGVLKRKGSLQFSPGWMSLTRIVPALVPSDWSDNQFMAYTIWDRLGECVPHPSERFRAREVVTTWT